MSDDKPKAGRKPAVTKEDVARVASELRAEGRPPSQRAMRERLGRGSFSTIGVLYNELTGRVVSESPKSGIGRASAEAALLRERVAELEAGLERERAAHRATLDKMAELKVKAAEAALARTTAVKLRERAAAAEAMLADRDKRLKIAIGSCDQLIALEATLQEKLREREEAVARARSDTTREWKMKMELSDAYSARVMREIGEKLKIILEKVAPETLKRY
jgi:hypothetical protein